MFKRNLVLPVPLDQTFFLWGPRQTGKSTLLHALYPEALWIDLLKAEEFRRYVQYPETLRSEVAVAPARPVVVDEIQKVPALLDEVHWLMENQPTARFALCGSSARKVRRGHANLLGGRALRFQLTGLVASEVGKDWDLNRAVNCGYLPRIYSSARPERLLNSYVADYLQEEIAAEGLVRNLPAFATFLSVASLSDTELVNFASIARDCGVSMPTVQSYFQILVDTLLGQWLPAYQRRPKRRVIGAPKFYFGDVGVVNVLAKRGLLTPGAELFGKAFENWVFHELSAYNAYCERTSTVSYWRLAGGLEVDFLVNHDVAIEAKASAQIRAEHLRGLRELFAEHHSFTKRLVVCLEPRQRVTEDGIVIMPANTFATALFKGEIF